MVSGGRALLKSIVYSIVLRVFSSRLLWLHQDVSHATPCLYTDSSPSWIRPMTVVSSVNLRSFTEELVEVQSHIYRQ